MTKLVIAGQTRAFQLPLRVVTFNDDRTVHLGTDDYVPRHTSWIRQIVLHSTTGNKYLLVQGAGPPGGARETMDAWKSDKDEHGEPVHSGAHFIVDYDGTVYQCADPIHDHAYHAGPWNLTSVGIEIKVKRGSNIVYEAQNNACADLVDILTAVLGIQRMVPINGGPMRHDLATQVVGVFGHYHLLDAHDNIMRGPWDPGPYLLPLLARRFYEETVYSHAEGQPAMAESQWEVWKPRQLELGLKEDGIPGPKTVARMRYQWQEQHLRHDFDVPDAWRVGLWTGRPCDEAVAKAMNW